MSVVIITHFILLTDLFFVMTLSSVSALSELVQLLVAALQQYAGPALLGAAVLLRRGQLWTGLSVTCPSN